MCYFGSFEESFYYAYVLGPEAFASKQYYPYGRVIDSLSHQRDVREVNFAALGIPVSPGKGPGCLPTKDANKHHVLVGGGGNRHPSPIVVRHTWNACIPKDSLALVADGFYMSTPEFTYLQLARILTPVQLALAGSALCASYYIDPTNGHITRRDPLTTKSEIAELLDRARNAQKKGVARMMLPYIAERAESPQEVNLFLLMSLPPHLGGAGIEGINLNYEIPATPDDQGILDRPSRRAFRIDCGIPELHTGAEFLGKFHDEQVQEDRLRMNALVAKGERIIQVTFRDLCEPDNAQRVANQFARVAGVPLGRMTPSERVARTLLLDELYGPKRPML